MLRLTSLSPSSSLVAPAAGHFLVSQELFASGPQIWMWCLTSHRSRLCPSP